MQFQAAVLGNYQDKEKDRQIGNYAVLIFNQIPSKIVLEIKLTFFYND
jgi:hypothetical protein